MLALILTASLFLQTERTASSRRDDVQAALTEAQMAVEWIGHCTAELPGRRSLEAEYQTLSSRLFAASRSAQALNLNIDPSEAAVRLVAAGTPRCTAAAVQRYASEARRSLTLAEAGIRADRGPHASGLWLGDLKLCGDRVLAVEIGRPEYPGARPGIVLRFSTGFAAQVRTLTAPRVGEPLSLVLDGIVLTSPVVREPVGEAVSISGPGDLPIERLRAAAAVAC